MVISVSTTHTRLIRAIANKHAGRTEVRSMFAVGDLMNIELRYLIAISEDRVFYAKDDEAGRDSL